MRASILAQNEVGNARGAASGVEAWNSQKVTIGNARFDHSPRVNVALSTGKYTVEFCP